MGMCGGGENFSFLFPARGATSYYLFSVASLSQLHLAAHCTLLRMRRAELQLERRLNSFLTSRRVAQMSSRLSPSA